MQLSRNREPRQLISLVPMIDVMLILLVFFMVTSTYLNLDMIPVVDRSESDASTPLGQPGESTTVLVRIGADGRPYVRGSAMDFPSLASFVAERLNDNPLVSVVLLPSTRASTQSLVTTMDTLTRAGATRLRLMQLDASR